jgi:hypothetical protein
MRILLAPLIFSSACYAQPRWTPARMLHELFRPLLPQVRIPGPGGNTVAASMSYQLNFRSTSGYVTDGAGQTYVLATDTYPTTRGGVTFGWETPGPTGHANRSTSLDVRLAGIGYRVNSSGGAAGIFRVALPATGTYNLRLAMGDANYSHTTPQLVI